MQYEEFLSDENDDQTLVELMNKHPDYVTEEEIEEAKAVKEESSMRLSDLKKIKQ